MLDQTAHKKSKLDGSATQSRTHRSTSDQPIGVPVGHYFGATLSISTDASHEMLPGKEFSIFSVRYMIGTHLYSCIHAI